MGDTNLDVSHEKSLSDLCVVYDLSNLADGPTCFKGDTPSSIDVLLFTEPKRFKSSLNSTCSISDFNNLTCFATKLHKPHIASKTYTIGVTKSLVTTCFLMMYKIYPLG